MTSTVAMTVNGRAYQRDIEPRLLLVHFLRDAGLTGTKIGCDTSQCGSCTVLMDGIAVKSCTTLAVQADGSKITTIEGLADGGKLSALQEAFWSTHGLQCGFCTPGMIFAAHEILANASAIRSPRRSVTASKATCAAARATRTSCARCRRPPIRGRPIGWPMTIAARTRLRVGHPAARRSAAAHRHGALHRRIRRCPAWLTRRSCAARTGTRASGGSTPSRASLRLASSPCSPARTSRAGCSRFRAPGCCRTRS